MRRQPEVSCPTCGAVWRQASARFCGSCGTTLGPPRPAAPAPRRLRRVALRRPAAAIIVALVVGAAAIALEAARPEGPGAEVALPDEGEFAGNRGPSLRDLSDTMALFDERRLRCQPEGCERWRRPLSNAFGSVVGVDRQLYALEDGDIVAIDADTGEDRWRHRMEGVVRAAGSGEQTLWEPNQHQLSLRPAGDGLLVYDSRGTWQLRDATGGIRWTNALPLRNAWWQVETGGLVLVAAESEFGSPIVAAIELATGTLRWSQSLDGGGVWEVTAAGVVVERDGRLEVLRPATGEVAFTVPHADGMWLEQFGPLLVLHEATSGPAEPAVTRLLDPEGSVTTELSGRLGWPTLELDGRLVAFLMPDELLTGPMSVVAIDLDGTIAWEHRVDGQLRRHDCCPEIRLVDGGAVVVRLPGGGAAAPVVVLDLATGEVRADVPVPALPPEDEEVWWEDGIGHAWSNDGLRLLDGRGGEVQVVGEGWPILGDPLVLISERELVGMQFPAG